VIHIRFDQHDPEAAADALVEVLRAAVLLTNVSVVRDAHAGRFVVTSLTRSGRVRTHEIGYDGSVEVRYSGLVGDEDLVRR